MCQLLAGLLVQVQRHDDVVIAISLDVPLLHDDEGDSAVGDHPQGTAAGDELHAAHAVRAHDDQARIDLLCGIPDVVENAADAHQLEHGHLGAPLFGPRDLQVQLFARLIHL